MQFKVALIKTTETGLSLIIIASLILAACGGGNASTSNTGIIATQLSGTNGDMSKYLGAWISDCGINYTLLSLNPSTVRADGVINRFDLTAVSGVSALGTLTTTTYNSNTNCSGTGTQAVATIFLQYASNVVITTPAGQTAFFTGSADRINYGAIGGVTVTPYNFAFRSNFSKFQLVPASSNYSIMDLIYTKQ